MNDSISRKWLMECVNEGWIKFDTEKDENRFIHLVRDIAPSAERKGHWINRNGNNIYPFWERYKCSVCGGNSNNSDYCPSCGARMDGE